MEQPSDRLFCCQWVRDRLPPTNREELYNILKMTGPLVGWSTESLQEWGSFMKLGIPSAVMFTLEGLVYNLGSVLAGIQTATCVRVGNALGAGDTDRAIVISKMSLYLAGFWLGLVLCTVLQVPFFIFVIFKKLNWKTLTKEVGFYFTCWGNFEKLPVS
ncbi:unnamed protein product [Tetraodon nigroviridis]|uniref:Chromosome 16 SCAF15002, whole genome shotgun sequence n=1 Tax=Tetraodon nigroviridis TaxID=99883 RepID=Q4RRN9_TETNG|nr:unnamed protein product [Tetraodon nigroviridis]